MFRNSIAALLFLLAGCLTAVHAADIGPRRLALVLGDVESRPAALAVVDMQDLLQRSGITVQVVPVNRIGPQERVVVSQADAVVVNLLGRQVSQSLREELLALQRAGRPVLAVGAAPDDELRQAGVKEDKAVQGYYRAGGVENMSGLLRHMLQAYFALDVAVPPVHAMPEMGLYNIASNTTYDSFERYASEYSAYRPGAPWIGIMFYRASLVSGQTLPLAAITARLEQAGYNVLPAFGYPYEAPLRHFLDSAGKSRIEALVALGMKVGSTAATAGILEKIGVPAINAITLNQQSLGEWQASPVGLDLIERSWQLSGAELAGLIQPTVVASREKVTDSRIGLTYIEERPIDERIERLVRRIQSWHVLRHRANQEKHVAVLYYNYPHGSETIGAAYLNVLPESLWQIVRRLQAEGYSTGEGSAGLPPDKEALRREIQEWGSYPNNANNAAGNGKVEYRTGLARLARSGQALLVPLSDYRAWYSRLPDALRHSVEKAWGKPDQAQALWRDAEGQAQFVYPARRYGRLLLAPQPGRAWEQNLEKLHDDVTLPPSHEYMAFYLWLQHGHRADAVVHVGTHGTQEWLTGKEAGLSEADASEALIGAMPNIYPYVMDDVGEGLQAKRRGMATIISHLTPPFDAAGLNPDLRELLALLNDYRVANQKSPLLARNHLIALNRLAGKSGVLKDMSLKSIRSEADLEALEEYLDGTSGKLTPFGLHTFGVAPNQDMLRATAKAVVDLDREPDAARREARIRQMESDMEDSARLELDKLMQALAGRYIAPGPSADLVRNPAVLPTGRNFYGLDPSRIPGRTTYEQGAALADRLIQDYRQRHGGYPDKITMNLWGVETLRHEGIMEAQAMALMGVKPRWDERGRVTGVEPISRSALGRPRVDVTLVSSGLFRDLFGNLLKLLDEASQLAQRQDEADNPLRGHSRKTAEALRRQGVPAEQADTLAQVRIFGLPSGAYGTNIEKLIPLANAWTDEKQVADVFINRMSHPFGQGYWGGQSGVSNGNSANAVNAGETPGVQDELASAIRRELFRQALSGSKIALHSRSSNLFATLDNDDFFQYLGGTALAIRNIDGKTPEVMVSDLSNPRNPRQLALEKYMGQELQTRYLNPRWADSMLNEGYAGTRFINRVVDYLWAWQVTVPEAIDEGKWQRVYDTYIADRHGLDVRRRFAESGNLKAFQAITDRMLSAVERGYWKPSSAVRDHLARLNSQAIAEAGQACSRDSCSRATLGSAPDLDAAVSAPGLRMAAVPGQAKAAPAAAPPLPAAEPGGKTEAHPNTPAASAGPEQPVSGYQMETAPGMSAEQKTIGALLLMLLGSIAVGIGYWHQGRKGR